MEVTFNASISFIKQHQEKIFPRKAIHITNFKAAPKTNYDHGEDECVLIVQ
jgi:hypothetical protein